MCRLKLLEAFCLQGKVGPILLGVLVVFFALSARAMGKRLYTKKKKMPTKIVKVEQVFQPKTMFFQFLVCFWGCFGVFQRIYSRLPRLIKE